MFGMSSSPPTGVCDLRASVANRDPAHVISGSAPALTYRNGPAKKLARPFKSVIALKVKGLAQLLHPALMWGPQPGGLAESSGWGQTRRHLPASVSKTREKLPGMRGLP
jgi:hypothetical protein